MTWNFPSLWPGGTWTIGDIVKYQTGASWALLVEAARDRRRWLESYAAHGRPRAGTLPAWGKEPRGRRRSSFRRRRPITQALQRLVWTLQHGQVEIREIDGAGHRGRQDVSRGQLRRADAAAVRRVREGAARAAEVSGSARVSRRPAEAPYDVTAHTLPLLFGVDVAAVMGAAPATGARSPAVAEPTFTSPAERRRRARRVAIYRTARGESMDEGWTRWMFDK